MKGKTVRRMAAISLVLLLSVALTGCWDMREIHNRNFVLAVGVDTADEGFTPGQSDKAKKLESFIQPVGDKRYRVSLQILRLVEMSKGEEGGDKSKTFVISNTGQSLFEMVRDMLGQTGKPLYFEHIQTVIISEAAARQAGLRPILDWFGRDAEGRWRIIVYITPTEARPFIEYRPPAGDPGGLYYSELIRNWKKNPFITGTAPGLGYTIGALDLKKPVILPRLEMEGDVVRTGGFALFKNDKFIKYISEVDTVGVKFIRGIEKGGVVTIPCLDDQRHVLTFEYLRHDTDLKPHVDNERIYFTLGITLYGRISEIGCLGSQDTLKPEYIARIETAVAEEVKRIILDAHAESQRLKIDMSSLGDEVAAHYPRLWRKIKSRWEDELLPQVPLYVSVNVSIRGIGEHK